MAKAPPAGGRGGPARPAGGGSKVVHAKIKLQVSAGEANPQPPVGPALGQHGVNIMDFVRRFNDQTMAIKGTILPVIITVYKDKSFDFITKSPPAAVLLKKAAEIAKGAQNAATEVVGKVSRAQVAEIVRTKMEDLNANDEAAAARQIEGTARSMGIQIVD
ncbi:MAG: 50S ribosomal protein L11 [Planctomycetes bacterium]|nr:50S ribosomal protein L11 [Planctomycetota bacterium]